MGDVMLNLVQCRATAGAGKTRIEKFRKAAPCFAGLDPVPYQARVGPARQKISELLRQMRPAVLVEGNMVDVRQIYPRLFEAVGNRARGKPSPVLDPAEAFFFYRGNEFSIGDKRRR